MANGAFGKNRPLSVALGKVSQAVAHVLDVDATLLEELVRQYQVPGGARGQEPLPVVRLGDSVARSLVVVALQVVGRFLLLL